MLNSYFQDKAPGLVNGLPKELHQLLHNASISADGSLHTLRSGQFPFSGGETYRTARAELNILHLIFEEGTKGDILIKEMYGAVAEFSSKV
jgi:hypothetical protein